MLPRLAWSAIALRVCHRRQGIGADGLLVAAPLEPGASDGGAEVSMRLHNADGSEAEMSGNGIRCLVQAWARRRGEDAGKVLVDTVAGVRVVEFGPGADRRSIVATVDMGPVSTVAAPPGWPDVAAHHLRPVAHLSVGNPHTVVAVDDVHAVDLQAIGEMVPGVNLEIVEPGPEPSAVTMRVHERGAGITEACGTGACAAAWAASAWGLVPGDGGNHRAHGRWRCEGTAGRARDRAGHPDRPGHVRRDGRGRAVTMGER